MSAKRILLALLIAGGVATGAAFFANSGSHAADTRHIDHVQHMAGIAAEVPTMPGQEIFGTIQEIVRMMEARHRLVEGEYCRTTRRPNRYGRHYHAGGRSSGPARQRVRDRGHG